MFLEERYGAGGFNMQSLVILIVSMTWLAWFILLINMQASSV